MLLYLFSLKGIKSAIKLAGELSDDIPCSWVNVGLTYPFVIGFLNFFDLWFLSSFTRSFWPLPNSSYPPLDSGQSNILVKLCLTVTHSSWSAFMLGAWGFQNDGLFGSNTSFWVLQKFSKMMYSEKHQQVSYLLFYLLYSLVLVPYLPAPSLIWIIIWPYSLCLGYSFLSTPFGSQ